MKSPEIKDNSVVTFRRIRGRIVPIRVTKSDQANYKKAAGGAAAVAAGVGVSVAGGTVYKKTLFKGIQRSLDAFSRITKPKANGGPLFEYAARQADQAKSFENLRKANRFYAAGTVVKRTAPAIGAGMITFGALRMINSLSPKKKKQMNPELVAGGAAAAAVVVPKAYNYSKKAFNAGFNGRQGVFDFAKANYAWAAPKVKDAAMKIFKAKF